VQDCASQRPLVHTTCCDEEVVRLHLVRCGLGEERSEAGTERRVTLLRAVPVEGTAIGHQWHVLGHPTAPSALHSLKDKRVCASSSEAVGRCSCYVAERQQAWTRLRQAGGHAAEVDRLASRLMRTALHSVAHTPLAWPAAMSMTPSFNWRCAHSLTCTVAVCAVPDIAEGAAQGRGEWGRREFRGTCTAAEQAKDSL
jgi:hypothetical protein